MNCLYWLLGIIEAKYSKDYKVLKKLSIAVLTKFGFGERTVMERLIHDEAGELIKYIKRKQGQAFDIKPLMQRATLNVVYNLLFGQRFADGDPDCEYIMSSANMLISTLHPVFEIFPLARFAPPFKDLLKDVATHARKMTAFYVDRVRECMAENAKEENNYVKEFMKEAGTKFDETDAAFVVRDFVIGSTEDVSETQILGITLIGSHPIVQERLRKEIDSVVPRSRLPSISDKASLPYFEATMLELLRVRNTPLTFPRVTMCDTEAGGFFIPANTKVE